MWIINEPKKVALWNKRHFEEKNGECAICLKYSVFIFVEKIYIKCNFWRVVVRPSNIYDAGFLKVKSEKFFRAEFTLHQNCVVRMNQIPETNKYQTPNFCHFLNHKFLNFFPYCKSLFLVPSFLFFFIDLSTFSLRSVLFFWFIFCLYDCLRNTARVMTPGDVEMNYKHFSWRKKSWQSYLQTNCELWIIQIYK
jgi:hypothetical protein